jgi:cyclophilin family peptidyl-prolyl cis-trans isomerase/HEAT repeat protein
MWKDYLESVNNVQRLIHFFGGITVKRLIFSALVIAFFHLPVFSQATVNANRQNTTANEYPEKIRDILITQDRRAPFDSKLIGLLDDSSAAVREKALMCYANLQDTNAIPLLVDRINSDAAVFAIGQTAGLLSARSRATLEHDIIYSRFDQIKSTSTRNRLIEEIGKFGTEQALIDLYLRFAIDGTSDYREGFIMSAARFAIRGVATNDVTQYLVNLAKDFDNVPWQAVYALQRIGNHQVTQAAIAELRPLFQHRNPLVRIHFATLLGKLKDPAVALDPLSKMAEFDGDWRVRVNALRALGNFDLSHQDQIIAMLTRSLSHENPHIPITALATIGNLSLKESDSPAMKNLFDFMKKISFNKDQDYLWQVQAEASSTLAKLIGSDAAQYINLKSASSRQAEARLLVALGTTGSKEIFSTLVSYVDKNDQLLSRSALDGLLELAKANPQSQAIIDGTVQAASVGLKSGDVAIIASGAAILGDSLCANSSSADKLLDALDNLHVPGDIEAIQEICSSLGKLKSHKAIASLEKLLNQPDRSVKLAALDALKSITGREYSAEMRIEPLYTDFDFQYLGSLPAPIRVKMETAKGDVVMELDKNAAPFTVMSFLKLAEQRGFFRGRIFHRIVPNFVVQGGDPRGDGWGGPEYTLRSEFSLLKFNEGTVGMASSGKDTEGSQFFITQSPQPHLDGKYTIIGKVISGMEAVNKLQVDDRIYDIKLIQ